MRAKVQIRPMAAADLAQVMALADASAEAPHWPLTTYEKAIDPDSMPRRFSLVAADASTGSIRGFAVASLMPPQAELETIAIAPESQRQGIATGILNAMATELKSSAIVELLLELRTSNRSALAFYHAHGFVQTGLRSRYYTHPVEDAIQMRLSLTSLH